MPDPASVSFDQNPAPDRGPTNHIFYPALDGLRALAFLMVFGQHYIDLSWGWSGVDIFFVLSGFLITGILFDTKDKPHRVWNFYIRRTLRIFPLYYGIFLLLLLAEPIFKWSWNAWWLIWPLYVGNFARFLHPYTVDSPLQLLADAQLQSQTFPAVKLYLGHFWSLCVEEQFYLFWPWIVFWVKDGRRLIGICVAAIVLSPLLRVLGHHNLPHFMIDLGVFYRLTLFRTDALLLGGLIALLIRSGYGERLLQVARIVFASCLTLAIVWTLLHPYARTMRLTIFPRWMFTWGLSFVDLFAAALIVMALQPASWTYRIFNLKPLRWMGRISYGAYVLHDIPHLVIAHLWKADPTAEKSLAVACIALPCTLLMAWLSFRFFESPFIRLKDKYSR